ncbi:hypothetical protein [Helicobacter fennelliae]|uniref:Hemolytic protein hlpA-like protein n=1 Tax=Helicobacter fennelliae MRY12-0050 TaxID=1325130 RepID=T1DVU4_9HELI|nr:hypothetical protein [Helicobacter fennelliae]GAD19053.1 hemolytic protein hlpA-like protein [Helicobacter fennelliae MRY12-0050]STP08458.1 methyltransferase [Helicobacter fennelliae]
MSYTCKNSILLLSFNRLDTLQRTLEQIAKHKPARIYLANDGARANHRDSHDVLESEKISTIRAYLIQTISTQWSWDCEIHTRFLDTNLGCKKAVSSAISWFFENEEQGIILEDDCLPNESFFRFCDELLERYKYQDNIFMISGFSGLDFAPKAKQSIQSDYFFSKYNHIWGWASWRRAWAKYELEFDFNDALKLQNFTSTQERRYWHNIFKSYTQGQINTWDYPWTFSIWKHNGLSIYPKCNMIQNIGFNREDSTHTTGDSRFANMTAYELSFPLIHPPQITQDIYLDKVDFHVLFAPKHIIVRAIKKAIRITKKLFGI